MYHGAAHRRQGNGPGSLKIISASLPRAAWAACLWFALAGAKFADVPGAIVAISASTCTSLYLLPPRTAPASFPALTILLLKFFGKSILAGIDVAWRALDPRLPLRPGFVRYESGLPRGTAQGAFFTMASLLPGTLPLPAEEDGDILVHCLDVSQNVQEQMAREETLFIRATGAQAGGRHV